MKLYSIRDRITGVYSAPFCCVNDDDCLRRVAVAYNHNQFSRDLELYGIASFDESTGKLDVCINYGNISSSFISNVFDIITNYFVDGPGPVNVDPVGGDDNA